MHSAWVNPHLTPNLQKKPINLEIRKLHKIAKQNMKKQKMVQDIQLEKDESLAPRLQILSQS
jgi:hypothetical protein